MVLTHVDGRFDTGMRDLIGADAARVLPLLDEHEFTFVVEDPATVWHLGPQRYPEIARRYQPLTPRTAKLAIDINIVERYQDVYPTKQQTGTELFQLLSLASRAFPRVMLYFENSILAPDVPLLAAAMSAVTRVERMGPRLTVESKFGAGVPFQGLALVNGKPWPAGNGELVWLPSGVQSLEPAPPAAGKPGLPARLLDLNGELQSAAASGRGIQFAYRTYSRAIAVLDRKPARQQIDSGDAPLEIIDAAGPFVIALPRGQHLVELFFE
jgi:hypothetical protein